MQLLNSCILYITKIYHVLQQGEIFLEVIIQNIRLRERGGGREREGREREKVSLRLNKSFCRRMQDLFFYYKNYKF